MHSHSNRKFIVAQTIEQSQQTAKRPVALNVELSNIPIGLKDIPRWVLWRYMPKYKKNGETYWSKLPVQADGSPAKTNAPETWTSYEHAARALQNAQHNETFDGLGFVFIDNDDLIGIDLDDCIDPRNGEYSQIALELLSKCNGYAEVSPSGTGIKLFSSSDLRVSHVDHSKGIEIYPSGRFFTITGHLIKGHDHLPNQKQELGWFIEKHFGVQVARSLKEPQDLFDYFRSPLDKWSTDRVGNELLNQIDPDCSYGLWIMVGMALHHQGQGSSDWLDLFDSWSSEGSKYVPGEPETHWASFHKQHYKGSGAVTLRSVIRHVSEQNMQAAVRDGALVLDPKNFMNNASYVIEHKFSGPNGVEIYHAQDQWYFYEGSHYKVMEDNTVRSIVWNFLDKAKKQNPAGSILPFTPSSPKVSGVIDALKAQAHLKQFRPPMWVGADLNQPATELVALENGLFHLTSQTLFPHTCQFFTLNALPFIWDPEAIAPEWSKFLDEIWPDDQEAIDTLQEMFGYLLTADTRMQKILMLLGPRRSGKGTIGRIINALIGPANIAGPTLASLTTDFGLEPLIGKLVALISDARTPGQGHQVIVERLLMISGEDTVSVNRKHIAYWAGPMTARIVIMTNEPLRLGDSSGALVGRLLVLQMHHSFYGREDSGLTDRLLMELPGIFNWALAGRQRLYARGRFIQPKSSESIVGEMARMNNPLSEFIDKCCDLEPSYRESKDLVYEAYRKWASRTQLHYLDSSSFARSLYGSQPSLGSARLRDGENRQHVYLGLQLKPIVKAGLNLLSDFDQFLV